MDFLFVSIILLILLAIFILGESLLKLVALILCVVNDLADFGIGSVPLVGDTLDILTFIILLLAYRNKYSFLSLVELIPFIDPLPLQIIAYILSNIKSKKD